MTHYFGWIMLPQDKERAQQIVDECNLELVEEIGDENLHCRVSEDGLQKLDKYWGEAHWGLRAGS